MSSQFLVKVQQQLDDVASKNSTIRDRKRKKVAANVVELEFPFDKAAKNNKARASHSGTLQFDDHDPFAASFITFINDEEPIARKIHELSSKVELPGMVKPLLLARCDHHERWILCFDHFECTLDMWEQLPATMLAPTDSLDSWWRTTIRNALITIKHIHQKHYTHTALHDERNYIIQSGSLKIINLMGERGRGDDPATIARKVQDLKDFERMLAPRFTNFLTEDVNNEDCRSFFAWFGKLTADNYDYVINKLITDPFLMSIKERLKYFSDIGIKTKDDNNPLKHLLLDENSVFAQYREWDSTRLDGTDKLKALFNTPVERNGKTIPNKFSGAKVTDLVRFIKNAYMHRILDGSYEAIDSEIRLHFGGLLPLLHEEYECESTEDCDCVVCMILRKGVSYNIT